MTLFALVLAIGYLVVYDLIVVVEAVQYQIDHNKLSAKEDILPSMKKVSGLVIVIALILCNRLHTWHH
ncbi:MAG: efflux RND transporter permease subunit [Flavobacteriales bacterium]